jgi:hypothetical protein
VPDLDVVDEQCGVTPVKATRWGVSSCSTGMAYITH